MSYESFTDIIIWHFVPGKANLGDNSIVGHGLRLFFSFADTPQKVDVIHSAKYFFCVFFFSFFFFFFLFFFVIVVVVFAMTFIFFTILHEIVVAPNMYTLNCCS